MATYTQLTDDEKAQIKIAAKRNLEYQMYALEVEVIAENAKTSPDAAKVSELEDQIAEKQAQIAAIV
jgi:type I restriction-modification system DNA methylase subunit